MNGFIRVIVILAALASLACRSSQEPAAPAAESSKTQVSDGANSQDELLNLELPKLSNTANSSSSPNEETALNKIVVSQALLRLSNSTQAPYEIDPSLQLKVRRNYQLSFKAQIETSHGVLKPLPSGEYQLKVLLHRQNPEVHQALDLLNQIIIPMTVIAGQASARFQIHFPEVFQVLARNYISLEVSTRGQSFEPTLWTSPLTPTLEIQELTLAPKNSKTITLNPPLSTSADASFESFVAKHRLNFFDLTSEDTLAELERLGFPSSDFWTLLDTTIDFESSLWQGFLESLCRHWYHSESQNECLLSPNRYLNLEKKIHVENLDSRELIYTGSTPEVLDTHGNVSVQYDDQVSSVLAERYQGEVRVEPGGIGKVMGPVVKAFAEVFALRGSWRQMSTQRDSKIKTSRQSFFLSKGQSLAVERLNFQIPVKKFRPCLTVTPKSADLKSMSSSGWHICASSVSEDIILSETYYMISQSQVRSRWIDPFDLRNQPWTLLLRGHSDYQSFLNLVSNLRNMPPDGGDELDQVFEDVFLQKSSISAFPHVYTFSEVAPSQTLAVDPDDFKVPEETEDKKWLPEGVKKKMQEWGQKMPWNQHRWGKK